MDLGLTLLSLLAIVAGSVGLVLARSRPAGIWPNVPPMPRFKIGDNEFQQFFNQVVFGSWLALGVSGLLSQLLWPGWVG